MNMKTLRKLLAAVCATALIVCISVGATIAYLQSKDQVVNTFTVGQVHIKLDEAPVDANGKEVAGDRVKANRYKLYPGQTYDKDPMVTMIGGSDDAYVRMLVTVDSIAELKLAFPKADYPELYGSDDTFLLQELVDWENESWPFFNVTTEGTKAVYEFRHNGIVNTLGQDDTALDPLFTEITIPGSVTNKGIDHLKNVTITVDAHAMQAKGFENDEAGAWEAFNPNLAN